MNGLTLHRRVALFLAGGLLAFAATAQEYPQKPVRLIVAYPPGGSIDILARTIVPKLSAELGQPVIIDNKAGGGGAVGADIVAHAAADGYTLGLAVPSMLTLPIVLGRKLSYEPAKDFTLVSIVAKNLLALVVTPNFPARSLKELVEYARKNPGTVPYGSSGIGSSNHLIGEVLNQFAGISMTHVAYRGSAPQMSDLLGGQVPVGIVTTAAVLQQVKAGKLRMLAVFDDKRYTELPDVPTNYEALPGYEPKMSWTGLVGPAGMPPAVTKRLHDAIAKVGADAEIRKTLNALGMPVVAGTPAEFAQVVQCEIQFWSPIVRKGNIKAE